MITLPQHILLIPVNKMDKTTLVKLSRARLVKQFKEGPLSQYITRAEELLSIACGVSFVAPSTETEKTLAGIYAGIFNNNVGEVFATISSSSMASAAVTPVVKGGSPSTNVASGGDCGV